MEKPEIIIFDENMVQMSRINSYSQFRWTHNWTDVDTFEFITNRYKQNVDELVEGGFVGYYDTIWGWSIGCVDSIRKPLDNTGKKSEMWTITGQGIESVLARRLMAHGWASGDGYDTQTAVAETNMRHYVYYNAVAPTDSNHALSGITLTAVNGARGIPIEYKARMPLDLSTVLRDHCVQSGLSYKLVWTGTGRNFVFTVYEGSDKSTLPDKVILSIEFGNVTGYDYTFSNLDERNCVYIGGPGDGASRVLEGVWTVSSGWERKETFVDASECTTVQERAAKGNQVLAERAPTQTLDFTFNPLSQSFVLGTDFNLGDTVVVDFPDVATMTSRIESITERYDGKGRNYEIGVGKSKPSLVSIIKQHSRKITDLGTR